MVMLNYLVSLILLSPKGRLQKKTSYLVTLSKKVGGGQDEITISEPLEIMWQL